VQHPHVGHLVLAAQASELSPRALLRQHFDQQIQRPHGRKQAQQMHAKELGGGVHPLPPARGTVRPAGVDEIVWDERIQKFKQCGSAGRRQVGVHARQTNAGNLTRQRQ
jgi:hypothetical protein